MAETDLAVAVADNHQSGKTEATATLHDLGDTIDVHQLVDQVAVFFLAVATATAVTTATAFTATAVAATIATAATAGGFSRRRVSGLLFVCHDQYPLEL
jgi:hypothetical protein